MFYCNQKKENLYIIISFILLLFWMFVIYNFSAQSATESANLSMGVTSVISNFLKNFLSKETAVITDHLIRKNAHFLIYLGLGFLTINFLKNLKLKKQYFISITFCFLYACTDEFHQAFVPGRGPAIKDVFIDSMGALLGICIFSLIFKIIKKRRKYE